MILIRRSFLTGMGLVYTIAFVSLWVQIDGLIGADGILPANDFLHTVAATLGPERWSQAPTLAWLTGADNGALHLLCASGTAASVLLMLGIVPAIAAAIAWAIYLSLFVLGQDFLSFQWDILLLEAGFLTILYAPPTALTPFSRGWKTEPSRPVTFLLRLLIAKLMFLSGLVKLSSGDPTWRDLTALTYHYLTTCLPTWTGWYMSQLSPGFHKVSAVMMFVVELVLPFGAFGPRPLRFIAAAGFVGLMLFIGATGNYGFFNLLAIVLCLPLLDDSIVPRALRARLAFLPELKSADGAPGWPLAITAPVAAYVVLLTPVIVLHAARFPLRLPFTLEQLYGQQSPFHLVNGYGLFANMTTERPEIILEGSRDGVDWRPYEFRWKPGNVMRRPAFVQPHMPRLDWLMWFAALGNVRGHPWFLHLCLRLLQGSRSVLGLFENNPFPDEPPQFLRATVYDYHFTTPEERSATGAWWRRELVRPYIPTISLSPDGQNLVAVSDR